MARKGARRHLKRLAVPRDWRIPRGQYSWAVRPRCGPHAMYKAIPLLNLIKFMIAPNYTAREAKRVLLEGRVLVDGVKRRDHKFPVGLMDVVSIPTTGKFYRVLPLPIRGLDLQAVEKNESSFKLCRIVNRLSTKGGSLQINLHDGRNVVVKKDEAKEEFLNLKTHDTVKIEVPSQNLLGAVKYEAGTLVLVSGGKNVGLTGRIEKIHEPKGTSLVTDVSLRTSDDKLIEVPREYTFAIGKEESLIRLPQSRKEQVEK